jgi:hypothetical protein
VALLANAGATAASSATAATPIPLASRRPNNRNSLLTTVTP